MGVLEYFVLRYFNMRQLLVRYFLVTTVLLTLFSCTNSSLRNNIEGTWVNFDVETDTLVFLNDSQFESRDTSTVYHWYNYLIKSKKIEVQYSGPNKIYVEPTQHDIVMAFGTNTTMSINFSDPSCYGFPEQSISYYKID